MYAILVFLSAIGLREEKNQPFVIMFSLIYRYVTEISDEQKEYQDLARKFAREVIIPVAPHHDKTGEVSFKDVFNRFIFSVF